MKGLVEALVIASREPVSPERIGELLDVEKQEVEDIISGLNKEYEESGRGFRLRFIAGGYQYYTLPEFHEYIKPFLGEPKTRLSASALEVLAVIALKQPVTRSEIERVRGVNSLHSLHRLVGLGLVNIVGRKKGTGSPFIYTLSDKFYQRFGLKGADDLPTMEELEEIFRQEYGDMED
ncbi:SMC-Scp complex subunit ScpB [bacterium]|nr:SMC-Scp complex subunit ScpB [bacterium]